MEENLYEEVLRRLHRVENELVALKGASPERDKQQDTCKFSQLLVKLPTIATMTNKLAGDYWYTLTPNSDISIEARDIGTTDVFRKVERLEFGFAGCDIVFRGGETADSTDCVYRVTAPTEQEGPSLKYEDIFDILDYDDIRDMLILAHREGMYWCECSIPDKVWIEFRHTVSGEKSWKFASLFSEGKNGERFVHSLCSGVTANSTECEYRITYDSTDEQHVIVHTIEDLFDGNFVVDRDRASGYWSEYDIAPNVKIEADWAPFEEECEFITVTMFHQNIDGTVIAHSSNSGTVDATNTTFRVTIKPGIS